MSYDSHIIVGKILTTHGIKGWFTIGSYTSSPKDIFDYKLKVLVNNEFEELLITEHNLMPKKIIMKVDGIETIASCEEYIGLDLYTAIDELPKVENNEYYWHDLIGCNVFNEEDILLGVADSLFNSGDNDILVVKNDNSKKEILIPFLKSNIILVEKNKIIVRWSNDI
ncbi:MAG: 16S rRNA processing protein RimM [Gammaproteobacteria bacterium]|nr:16S rRNA processing protein RimM [Gammaproteobacteria bacterium]MBT6733817.1 16S rRNA processing protein RimM [Gammaproteobacteria bacterium]|tara:strand:+ start:78 stop:581 length:504 start_codon:yes stop_codon:yes gene_type:complete